MKEQFNPMGGSDDLMKHMLTRNWRQSDIREHSFPAPAQSSLQNKDQIHIPCSSLFPDFGLIETA
jgi:hypothetical protein